MRSDPPTFDFQIGELATVQHGVVARRQLIELGLSEPMVGRLLARGRLHGIHRGVYAVGHKRLTKHGRYMAAVLACGPTAVLSHRCAADLWGLKTGGTRLEVSVPGTQRRRPKHILLYQPRDIPPRHRGTIDAIPVTSLARTLVDLAAVVDPTRLGRAWEEADRTQRLDVRAVDDVLAGVPNGKGTGHIRALIAERRTATDTREGMERDFADIIRKAGLPTPAYNALIEGFLVDAVWVEQRLIVELDSFDFHDRTRKSHDHERERHTALQLKGWQVVRLTSSQMPNAANIVSALL